MNKLLSIRWKPFVISDIFTISPGKRLTKAVMKVGKRPFIGATDSNNGITAWVDNTNESLDKLVLGVNYNGSVVETFFHPYECIFSDDVKRLHLKNGITSYHVMLFLKTMIIQQKVKFEYGYKFNEKRMKRQKILLPVTDEDSPDWQFMEEYMRRKEILLLKPTIEKLCKQLILRENLGGVNCASISGNHFLLQRFSQKFSVENVLKKQITQKVQSRMFHPRHSTMEWMDSSVMKAA
ncbi:restriction endonuclease subunit S [Segatella copri]|uniref:restriction endonuclease subunit S n=1 Tax=Segatella copri TaxID=165179 RepID=UPI003460A20C